MLLAEDDHDIRELLVELLETSGYHVEVAADGVEALERLRARPADVALLDRMMPRLDGCEVVRRMQQDPALRAVPVVLMTAAPQAVPADLARQVPVLAKPFQVSTLLALLSRATRAV